MPCVVSFPVGEPRVGCPGSRTGAPCKRCSEKKAMESLATCSNCRDLLRAHGSLAKIPPHLLCDFCKVKFCRCKGKGKDCRDIKCSLRVA
jgi:hypothetical protein